MDKAKVDVERIKEEWSSFWRRSYRFTRCRLSRLFFFVTACCAVVTALIWYFALFDDLQVRILMSLVIVLIPMFDFQPPPRTSASREELLWFSSLVAVAVLLVAGDKFEWASVAINPVLLLMALPYGWLVWKLMRRNGLLLGGLILALAVMMIFWTAALVRDADSLEVLLLPLPDVLFFAVAWAPVAWWALDIAGRWKNRRVGGPGMRALAMVILFFPVILVAMEVPGMLGLSSTWSAVCLTLVGVLLSAVISEPLRRFLLEWGNLMPDREPVPKEEGRDNRTVLDNLEGE